MSDINPILNNPYEEPRRHYATSPSGELNYDDVRSERRPFTGQLQVDEEAFANLYGHRSRPFPVRTGQKIAVRVVSQFGEETTKILTAGE